MKITYDNALSNQVWDIFAGKIKNRACPFCGREVTKDSCGGFLKYKEKGIFRRYKIRAIHKSLPCLLMYGDYASKKESL